MNVDTELERTLEAGFQVVIILKSLSMRFQKQLQGWAYGPWSLVSQWKGL